jgi:hypothetical protein
VAVTDTYGLYNSDMGSTARGGIARTGTSGSYTYATKANMGDKPVNTVSWYDTLRFANWLTNDQPSGPQGSGTTETGSYTLTGPSSVSTLPDHAVLATGTTIKWLLTSEDEWHKAAYYKGGGTSAGYWDYPTGVDVAPTPVQATDVGVGRIGAAGTTPVTSGNYANYNQTADWNGQNGNVTTVGTNGGTSPYDTFDQGGNVFEWTETISGSNRIIRGGSLWNVASYMHASTRPTHAATSEYFNLGFRVSVVPEPTTLTLLALGGLIAVPRRRK